MIKHISTKKSGRQVIYYENNDKKFAIPLKSIRCFYNEDRYDINDLPNNIKSTIVDKLIGIIDDSPEFILGSIIYSNNKDWLCKECAFFSKKETIECDNNFTMIN